MDQDPDNDPRANWRECFHLDECLKFLAVLGVFAFIGVMSSADGSGPAVLRLFAMIGAVTVCAGAWFLFKLRKP